MDKPDLSVDGSCQEPNEAARPLPLKYNVYTHFLEQFCFGTLWLGYHLEAKLFRSILEQCFTEFFGGFLF